jgi:putative toxin-antitoxin system antitoxin component (TIGR02293 family)
MTKKASCKIASVKTYEDKEGGRKSVGRISEHRGGIAGTYGVQNMQNVPDFISACVSANISEIKSVLTKGLPIKYYDYLIDQMRMPSGDLAAVLDISSKTLYNRKHAGNFNFHESERIIRYIRIFRRAVEVLGGEENARLWFSTPLRALGDENPLEFTKTEIGAREVEDLLGRIEHGVYS